MTVDHAAELVVPDASRPTGLGSPRALWWRLRQDRFAVLGLITCAVYVLVALLAPLIVHAVGVDPYTYDLDALDDNGAPAGAGGGISAEHWFGVEPLTGRDLFAVVLLGSRTSLAVGIGATVVAVLVGTLLGVIAGYLGGWVDWLVARGVDILLGLPALIFMIAIGAVVPPWFPRVALLMLVIGFFGWTSVARVVRGQALELRSRGFVRTAHAMGASGPRILRGHILPNVAATVVVFETITIPGAIASEAALSFLGVGVPPPTPSWGRAIGDAVSWFATDPAYLLFPGLALVGLTLALNALGDGLRDALDPTRARR